MFAVGAALERAAGFLRAAADPRGSCRMSYTIEGATGAWEVVIGLEVHAQVISNAKLFSGAGDRVRRRAEHAGELRRCGVPRHAAGDQPRMRGAGGAHRARARTRRSTWSAGSTARTTSTPTCRPAIRSASTQHPIVGAGAIEIELADGSTQARSASPACIWSRTPASRCTTSIRRKSYIDLNRSGVALMEIVSEPDHAQPGGGRRLSAQAAHHPALSRHLRRQHGGGLACAPT